MKENPKCPYCGEEMIPEAYGTTSLKRMNADWVSHNRSEQDTRYCFQCSICESESPLADTYEAAYATAMKLCRAKGEWVYEEDDDDWVCSVCGHDAYTKGDYRQVRTNYCPDCGADMRKEKYDEGA